MRKSIFLAMIAFSIGGSAATSVAQQSPPTDAETPQQSLRALYLQDASEYQFFIDADRTMELTLQPEPVLTWTGTEGWSGDVFVWTRDGRPGVIGGIGSWPDSGSRNIFHEFHTLLAAPLPEVSVGEALWSPADGQVELRPLTDAPAPAQNERLRLLQMRRLAARFEPHMLAQAGDEILRMLPQPIYRYRDPGGDVIDGALFGYVFSTTGTDLDFVLLLECRTTDDGPTWHYTPARFAQREMWLRYQNEEVWRVDYIESPTSGRLEQPYVTLPVRTVDDAG